MLLREDVEKIKAAGMNEHLSKPIEPALLYATVNSNGASARRIKTRNCFLQTRGNLDCKMRRVFCLERKIRLPPLGRRVNYASSLVSSVASMLTFLMFRYMKN